MEYRVEAQSMLTPGPWSVDKARDTRRYVAAVYDSHSNVIALVERWNTTVYTPSQNTVRHDEVNMATARLIAAAPDLLQTLQNIIEWQDDTREDFTPARRDLMIRNAARAAIAKAEGE